MCNNQELVPGYFVEWQYFSPILHRPFAVKDTVIEQDGHRYRLELAFDISMQEEQCRIIVDYGHNEALINEGLRLSLSSADSQESIGILLEYLGKALKSERAYIFETEPGCTYSNTYEWCAEGVIPQKEHLQHLPFELMKLWLERFQNNKNVIIRNIEDVKEKDPDIYELLVPQDIHSLVVNPLIYHDEIIGFYGVDNPPEYALEHISDMFQIMGHFLVSLLRRRDLVRRLENLSFYDQLTGLGNRHGMNHHIASMKPEQSIGIVYCDVMGLKHLNDSKGHQAGDELLVRAANSLKRVFGEYSLFRVGGDEFLVLCSGITEEALEQKADVLRQDMKEHAAMMALGYVWRPDSREDMDKLIAEADQQMYKNKRHYYGKEECSCSQLRNGF
jgi:diguanylate cyclase (GGDEF)-like protein